jgi:hypothetical protein
LEKLTNYSLLFGAIWVILTKAKKQNACISGDLQAFDVV